MIERDEPTPPSSARHEDVPPWARTIDWYLAEIERLRARLAASATLEAARIVDALADAERKELRAELARARPAVAFAEASLDFQDLPEGADESAVASALRDVEATEERLREAWGRR